MPEGLSDRTTYLCLDIVSPGAGPLPGDWDPLATYREPMHALVATHGGAGAGGPPGPAGPPGLPGPPGPTRSTAPDIQTATGSFFATFGRAPNAVAAALALAALLSGAADEATDGAADGAGEPPPVRMALHTGDAAGCRQLLKLAHAGQVLVARPTAEAARPTLPVGARLLDLGTHRLRDLQTNLQVYQLHGGDGPPAPGLLRSLDHLPHNLPAQLTSFVGRAPELAELENGLQSARLLTLVGAGGIGKTRLALQVAAAALDRYTDGAWLVELAPIRTVVAGQPGGVPATGCAVGPSERAMFPGRNRDGPG